MSLRVKYWRILLLQGLEFLDLRLLLSHTYPSRFGFFLLVALLAEFEFRRLSSSNISAWILGSEGSGFHIFL